jgi:hypothetical protein
LFLARYQRRSLPRDEKEARPKKADHAAKKNRGCGRRKSGSHPTSAMELSVLREDPAEYGTTRCAVDAIAHTSIDLFCGAGGITDGFRRAGFSCFYANDIDHWAIETFRANHPNTTAENRPIEQVDAVALRRWRAALPWLFDQRTGAFSGRSTQQPLQTLRPLSRRIPAQDVAHRKRVGNVLSRCSMIQFQFFPGSIGMNERSRQWLSAFAKPTTLSRRQEITCPAMAF